MIYTARMYLRQIIILCALLYTTNARDYHFFRMRLISDDGCVYKGYIPGGGVRDVGRIKAPTARIANIGMSAVLGKMNLASDLGEYSVDAVDEFLGKLKATSGYLGASLGTFGVATGLLEEINDVEPDTILEAVNEAMAQLTRDMNNKLESMKGYVEGKVINLEKRLIKDSYEKYYIFWRNCMEEVNIEDMVECQREAYTTIASALPEFAIYDDELFKNTYVEPYKAREIEAYLVVFRDYANLVFMMLKPLVQTYENDKSAEGVKQYARYSGYMKEKAAFFIKYAKAAVKAIKKAHSSSPCTKTFACHTYSEKWEGWWAKVHTADSRLCTCTIDENTKLLCKVNMYARVDTDKNWVLSKFTCPRQDFNCALEEYAKVIVKDRIPKYIDQDIKVLSAYWQKEVLDFIPTWQHVLSSKAARRDESSNILSDEADISLGDEPEERPGAEERRKARLAKAEKELNMLHF